MEDPFAYWRAALHAKQMHLKIPREQLREGEQRKPECGYYRIRTSRRNKPCWEAVAFYPDNGDMVCERQFGLLPRDLDEQTELFAQAWDQPVDYETYVGVTRHGRDWPDGDVPPPPDEPENERAVMGHNEPPEQTPVTRGWAKFEQAKSAVRAWLSKCPEITELNAAQGDRLSMCIASARKMKQELEKQRKEEVDPHVQAQKDINAKWKPLIEAAESEQQELSRLWNKWRDNAQRKANEAARKANEEAQRAAEEERKRREAIDGATEEEPPPPPPRVEAVDIKGATGTRLSERVRHKVIITDLRELVLHMLEKAPKELLEATQPYANRAGRAGNLPGTKLEEERYVA